MVNYYAALARESAKADGEPADVPPPGPDAVPPGPRADINATTPEPPEATWAQAERVSEECVVDAFTASAKAERHRQKTQRKNHRRREESRRSARADTRLRHGMYEALPGRARSSRDWTPASGLSSPCRRRRRRRWPGSTPRWRRGSSRSSGTTGSGAPRRASRRRRSPPTGQVAEFASRTPSSRATTLSHRTRRRSALAG